MRDQDGIRPDRLAAAIDSLEGIRLQPAWRLFVTICTQNREYRFGEVLNGAINLSASGEMVLKIWNDLPARFPGVTLDEFIVMPNHVHGILILEGAVGADLVSARDASQNPSLPRVIQAFKSLTTNAYTEAVKAGLFLTFHGRLWQRNYYEGILRGDIELAKARQYIQDNPARWENDEENPFKA